ncbi:MAG TPA: phenylalanine--tRNA ligase subunit alpha [Polyangiaceae bacterium]|nr:phenylalanine--tRNA ligase subunit alpha [Polyangiaceae bacterium]
MENPQQILQAFRAELAQAKRPNELRDLRVKYLGKKSELKSALKSLREIPAEQRAEVAKQLNDAQATIESELLARESTAQASELSQKLEQEWVDIALPGLVTERGVKHPVRVVEERCLAVLRQLGFQVASGPEVESPFYNFDALNIPPHHPARDMQDTFWVQGDLVLRSHTSTIQARTLEKRLPLPLKYASPGRVYRNEAVDATHLAMFHQLEGFWVEQGLSFAHLKGVLSFVAGSLYENRKFRFKPKFYPYTEPSIGLDIACLSCGGEGCGACHDAGWVTIIGAGMIHPKIMKSFGYTEPGVRGIAFGWGTTRMTAQWLGLSRAKSMYEQDMRFLRSMRRRPG